jgi:hypothetical protein
MRVRWIGLTLALVLLAGALGYGAAALGDDPPTTFSPAAPVPAQSPSIPVDPPPTFAADIEGPPLATDLAYKPRRLGPPGFQWRYDAPAGWQSSSIGVLEVRWFDNPTQGGYGLRLKIVNERLAPAQMVGQKLAAIESIYEDVEVIGQDNDELSFSYRDGNDRQRFNTFKWFTAPGGGLAEFEMSVVGRRADVDGLESLFEHVAASVAKVR